MRYANGAVYTKSWVVDLMLQHAGFDDLAGLTIVEPACGDGAFLLRILEQVEDYESIHAYDIDGESVAELKRAAATILEAKGVSHDCAWRIVERMIICGDFIELAAAGLVPEADLVIGNPPYIRASDLLPAQRQRYSTLAQSMTMGTDIYVAFIEMGLSVLKPGGTLTFICADRWLQNRYGTRLRELVGLNYDLTSVLRMHGVDAFAEAVDAYPAITTIVNRKPRRSFEFVSCSADFGQRDVADLLAGRHGQWVMSMLDKPDDPSDYIALTDGQDVSALRDIVRHPLLEEAGVHIGIGIATGRDAVFITETPDLVEDSRTIPLFYMRDHRRNTGRSRWLINPWEEDGTLIDLDAYPRTKAYFAAHRDSLERRHVAKANPAAWYRTIDKLKPGLRSSRKLLLPDISESCDPVLETGEKYPHHNCYWITSDEWSLEALGGLLMSDYTATAVAAVGVKMRGGCLRFQAQYLRTLHIPKAQDVPQRLMDELAEAFRTGDRHKATQVTALVYGLGD